MIKLDIINEVVSKTGITKTKAEMAVETVFESMKKALGHGDRAAGLDGIAHHVEPPPAFEGDLYSARGLPQVPHSLTESIHALAESEWARTTFGEDVVDHYLHFFRTEQRKFDSVVTDWERKRYFEMA